ncbi:ABC transporter permease [Luteipulveratus mongoliensis]|uniref:ABC transporter permease n=1 Tax=Luteipulveratus mongoliensis TaxID=571913 RepID=A0A0K1JI11_9MICO|nr:ABC transporter permease [Luteipulveratus mongoliensis]AKU16215.1 ABC transporter permease [Luteipulveratus mongoliensis]
MSAGSSRLLRSELTLVLGRRRNQVGMLVLAAVPIVLAISIKVAASAPGPEAPNFLGSVTQNGLFVPLAALGMELPFFLPLAIGLVAGDSVAGEANIGTLRYLLTVPVSRTRLLVLKFTMIVIAAAVAALLIVVVGAAIGIPLFGTGRMTLLSGTQIGMGDAVLRILIVTAYVVLCLASLGAIGLFLSTLTEQPIGAAIGVIAIDVISLILDQIPQLDWLGPYLPTHHWTAFIEVFRDPINWDPLVDGVFVALTYIVVAWLAAWARFSSKDVTS